MGHPAGEPKSTDKSVRATAAGESGGGSPATNSDHSRTIGNCCPTSRTRSKIYHYITYPCRRADIFGVRRLAPARQDDKSRVTGHESRLPPAAGGQRAPQRQENPGAQTRVSVPR